MLNARNLNMSFGKQVILKDACLTLLPKERIALVGQNGVGKSTLLHLLGGESADSGQVEMAKAARIGLLRQTPDLDNNATVVDTMRSAISHHLENIEAHQKVCAELANCADPARKEHLINRVDTLSERIEINGGFDTEYLLEKVLSKLSIKARSQKIWSLSGGEKRRVDLARILLMSPDIYLLDEPTNHLDLSAIQFLIETFSNISSAVLFVSHDSSFVDELATRVVELSNGKLYSHEPPFANYLENKLIRDLIDERTLHRREQLIATELNWLRAGTPARTTKQNARINRAYQLIEQAAAENERLHKQRLQLEVSDSTRLGNTILEFHNLGAAFEDRILFSNLTIRTRAHQRYGIIGRNGCGKSTLLGLIAKKINPSYGHIVYGKNTEVVEFDQHRTVLDPEKTLKETLADHGDYVRINNQNIHIASYLERYLFSSSDANRKVSTLSGGEQNRLMLAKLLRRPANCLLLDEPTNDLDVESLVILEQAILNYDGVVFIVSHDRRFLDRTCTNILAFQPTTDPTRGEYQISVNAGTCGGYAMKAPEKTNRSSTISMSQRGDAPKSMESKQRKRRGFKEEREFQASSSVIEQREEEKQALEKEILEPSFYRNDKMVIQSKLDQLRALEAEIEQLYARWQQLMDMGD